MGYLSSRLKNRFLDRCVLIVNYGILNGEEGVADAD